MPPKEPTKHQLSARLTYSQHTPSFLRKLQSRVSGVPDEDSDDENPEFEDDGSGRPPIPRRPPIPERPASDPGSGDEDRNEEAPQVVVLKEGKHLNAWEVENEKRKAKGLPSLPDPSTALPPSSDAMSARAKKQQEAKGTKNALSFSSSGQPSSSSSSSRPTTAKRKAAIADGRDEDEDEGSRDSRVGGAAPSSKVKAKKKKPKVGLSFADDA